jgi:hypothetical protein
MRGMRPLTAEEILEHNRRIMGAEFHSEVPKK